MTDITWLPNDEFRKAEGQMRLQLGEILSCFNIYGLDALVPGAIEKITEVAIDFSKRVRGDREQPIRVKKRRNPRV